MIRVIQAVVIGVETKLLPTACVSVDVARVWDGEASFVKGMQDASTLHPSSYYIRHFICFCFIGSGS